MKGQIINHPTINMDKVVEVGKTHVEIFEQNFPSGFHKAIPHSQSRLYNGLTSQANQSPKSKVVNTEVIYARAMGLQNSARKK